MAARKIEFTEKEVTINNVTDTMDNVTLINIEDTGTAIVAKLRVMFIRFERILWDGPLYQSLENFTSEDIDARVIELL